MDSNQKNLNLNKVLPTYLAIKSAGSDLYRIGLSLFPFGSQQRNKYHNPYIIISIFIVFMLRLIVSLILSDDNYNIFIYIGDFAYFLDKESRLYLNSTIFFCIFFLFVSHLMHFWYYKKDIKPSYLKPFEMMSR